MLRMLDNPLLIRAEVWAPCWADILPVALEQLSLHVVASLHAPIRRLLNPVDQPHPHVSGSLGGLRHMGGELGAVQCADRRDFGSPEPALIDSLHRFTTAR